MRQEDTRPLLPGAGAIDDYTNAFLISAGVLCYVTLIALWATVGWPTILIGVAITERFLR